MQGAAIAVTFASVTPMLCANSTSASQPTEMSCSDSAMVAGVAITIITSTAHSGPTRPRSSPPTPNSHH